MVRNMSQHVSGKGVKLVMGKAKADIYFESDSTWIGIFIVQ